MSGFNVILNAYLQVLSRNANSSIAPYLSVSVCSNPIMEFSAQFLQVAIIVIMTETLNNHDYNRLYAIVTSMPGR